MWLEDPIPPENVAVLKEVKAATRTPICTGENLYTRHGFLDLIGTQATDIISPDLAKAGGLSEGRRIADLAGRGPLDGQHPLAPAACSSLRWRVPALEPAPAKVAWPSPLRVPHPAVRLSLPASAYRSHSGQGHYQYPILSRIFKSFLAFPRLLPPRTELWQPRVGNRPGGAPASIGCKSGRG